jgi:hypothetical protein
MVVERISQEDHMFPSGDDDVHRSRKEEDRSTPEVASEVHKWVWEDERTRV